MRHLVDSSFVYILLISFQITCFSPIILQNQVWGKCYAFYMNMEIKCLKYHMKLTQNIDEFYTH